MGEKSASQEFVALLEEVVGRVMRLDTQVRSFGTSAQLTRAEIHGVEAIGQLRETNLTSLAAHLGITKGGASQQVTRLVKAGMVQRKPSPRDAREKLLSLTQEGQVAFQEHVRFHALMDRSVSTWLEARQRRGAEPPQELLRELITLLEQFAADTSDI